MIIRDIIKRGNGHDDFCEDSLFHIELSKEIVIGGVFDGCSSGIDSRFASTLLKNCFKTSCIGMDVCEDELFYEIKHLYKGASYNLLNTANILKLQINEMLSTSLVFIYSKKTKDLHVCCVGDGVIIVDGEVEILKNDRFIGTNPDKYENMPNYLGYDIYDFKSDSFNDFFDNNVNIFSYKDVNDFTISTDGILSFIDNFGEPSKDIDVINYLTDDMFLIDNEKCFSRKVNILNVVHGLKNYDDLGIIRVVNF